MLRQGRERVRKALDARFDVLAQQVGRMCTLAAPFAVLVRGVAVAYVSWRCCRHDIGYSIRYSSYS